MGQPRAHNRPTLGGHISTTTAIGPGDLDMVDRKSRALPDEVLTCRWSGFHVQRGRVKVLMDNYTTVANPLQVTPRMCSWCMCVSRGMGNMRWLVLVVELGHDRKLVPIYPPRPSPQVTRELGLRGPVCCKCEIFFVLATQPSAGAQLSGHLRRRSWWLNRRVFSGVSMLHGQRDPPQVSHMARHTHAPAAHPGCYLQRNRTGC
jgi:hypothetical protein